MFVFKYVKENSCMQSAAYQEEKILLFDKVNTARSFFKKLAGLIFNKPLNLNEGLLIEDCNSIHTFWMKFSIDAVFIDKNNAAVHLVENLRPFRLSPVIAKAVKVLELRSGAVKDKGIRIADIFVFKLF